MNEQPTVNPTVECMANTVPTVPDDWAKLGAVAGYNPRAAENLRLWVEGPIGEGKTTFNAGIPKQLILDFEGGACAVEGGQSVPIFISNYGQYEAITRKLVDDAKEGKQYWSRIGFDTVDLWVEMIKIQLETEKKCEDITEYGREGKGYNLIFNQIIGKLRELELSGYTWSVVGHLKMKQETDPVTGQTVTRPRPSVYPSIAGRIKGNADFCLTAYSLLETERVVDIKLPGGAVRSVKEKLEKPIQKYLIDSRNVQDKEGKTRGVSNMPRKIEVPVVGGWFLFKKEYEAAVAAVRKKYQKS
jgi:hypothetical protein